MSENRSQVRTFNEACRIFVQQHNAIMTRSFVTCFLYFVVYLVARLFYIGPGLVNQDLTWLSFPSLHVPCWKIETLLRCRDLRGSALQHKRGQGIPYPLLTMQNIVEKEISGLLSY